MLIASTINRDEDRNITEISERRLGALIGAAVGDALGFVRRDCVKLAEKRFAGKVDVTFVALEDVAFGWDYLDRRQPGLPGRPQAATPPALGSS